MLFCQKRAANTNKFIKFSYNCDYAFYWSLLKYGIKQISHLNRYVNNIRKILFIIDWLIVSIYLSHDLFLRQNVLSYVSKAQH